MDPVSIVAGGIAFATALKDIISLGLKLGESLQNMKQDMKELRMLSQQLLTDMYQLQEHYDRVAYIDTSQSEHLLYELDGVKLRLERILTTCQSLVQGRRAGLFPPWAEWNLRRTLVNELPRLRRQVESIRSHFTFHSTIRIEHTLLVQSTEHSALLHRSQSAVAALLSNPDSDYAHFIVAGMDHDVKMSACSSVAVQYLKLQITSLWAMAERPLSNAPSIPAQPRWDPNSSEPRYLYYCSSASIRSLSQQVLSLFVELSSGFCNDSGQLLNGLTNIVTHISVLGMHRAFPRLMCTVEEAAKRIASNQRSFTVDYAYFIGRMAYNFSASKDTESALTWGERCLQVIRNARSSGLWGGENTSHLSVFMHLLHGKNCLKSPRWITHAGDHFREAQEISRQLLDLSSPECPAPSVVQQQWLRATVNLVEYHQRVGQLQEVLSHTLEGLSYYLHIDLKDIDGTSTLIARDLNRAIQKALTTLKTHDIPLTAVRQVLILFKRLSRMHPHIFAEIYFDLFVYEAIATYFLSQDTKAPSDQQLRIMQAFLGTKLGGTDSRCLDSQLRHALSSSFELQGEDDVCDIFFAYLMSYSSIYDMDMAIRKFIRDIITQLTIRFPLLMQTAIAEFATWCSNAAIDLSFEMEYIVIGLSSNLTGLPFKPGILTATSTIHTLLSLLPRSRRWHLFDAFVHFGHIEAAKACLDDNIAKKDSHYMFFYSLIQLLPDSLSLAVTCQDDPATYTMEFLASHHRLRDTFTALNQDFGQDLLDCDFAIIMYHAGNYRRAQKILYQYGDIDLDSSGFWRLRYYAALSHYHLHQFNEGLEVMQYITDEVRLWSAHGHLPEVLQHSRARLFPIYASLLAAVNRLPEALNAAQEGTRSYRSMVSWGPGVGPFFAQSLETYSLILECSEASRDVGNPVAEGESTSNPNSVDVWTEAVDVWRGLAKKDEFFSMTFVDSMEVYQEKLGKVGRDEECERIGKEIEKWREGAEKVRREKKRDIEELEKAWKEAYPDWTDEEEQFFSADEGDGLDDTHEFFSADEGESEDAKE